VVGERFFDGADEIRQYLEFDRLFILDTAGGAPVGCGVARPVLANGRDVDIGMVVAPDARRRGYGTFIMSHLKA